MKTNKLLIWLLLISIIVFGISGCKSNDYNNKNNELGAPIMEREPEDTVFEDWNGEEIINKDGEKFAVDTEVIGSVSDDLELNSNKITLAGKTYSFPLRVSELIDDGWYFPEDIFLLICLMLIVSKCCWHFL